MADSLAAQLRAQLVKANESLAYLKENLDATWCMVDVKDLEAIVAALAAAADRLDTQVDALAACQRELAEAHAFLTGKGETGYCMTHPSGQPDTELGKAAQRLKLRAEAAEALLRDRGWQTTQCAATAGHPDARCGLEAGHDGQHFCGDPRTGYGYRWPVPSLSPHETS